MTKTELKAAYVQACVRAGTKPNVSEESMWQKAYAYAEKRDLESAIDAHFRTQKFMPRESELYTLIEQARRGRTGPKESADVYRRYRCGACGKTVGCLVRPSDDTIPWCQSCRRDMVFVSDTPGRVA